MDFVARDVYVKRVLQLQYLATRCVADLRSLEWQGQGGLVFLVQRVAHSYS